MVALDLEEIIRGGDWKAGVRAGDDSSWMRRSGEHSWISWSVFVGLHLS